MGLLGIAGIITAVAGAVLGLGALIGGAVQSAQQMKQNQEILQQQQAAAEAGRQTDLQMNQQNIQAQKETNQANITNQNEQNAIMRAREDNAVQRRAEDLQAAGINPMLAGLQGASAQNGLMAVQQAPIADTSIGSRYATNILNLLDSFGAREQERRKNLTENLHETSRQATAISAQLTQIAKTKTEIKLMEAQYNNLSADTKKKFKEILKIQKEIEEKTANIAKSKEETKFIREMITTEPLKRALIRAQTKTQYKNIELTQQKILNLKEEKLHEIIKESETLERISLSQEAKKKIQQEVENLMIDNDIKDFARRMLVLDKTTSISKEYVQMFTSIMASIFNANNIYNNSK